MAYTAKDYGRLIGMEGFSQTLLNNHFTLYQGYVTNTNKVMDTLSEMAKAERSVPRSMRNSNEGSAGNSMGCASTNSILKT
jgi:superoxide dismutase